MITWSIKTARARNFGNGIKSRMRWWSFSSNGRLFLNFLFIWHHLELAAVLISCCHVSKMCSRHCAIMRPTVTVRIVVFHLLRICLIGPLLFRRASRYFIQTARESFRDSFILKLSGFIISVLWQRADSDADTRLNDDKDLNLTDQKSLAECYKLFICAYSSQIK
jgi:hypothetical protein